MSFSRATHFTYQEIDPFPYQDDETAYGYDHAYGYYGYDGTVAGQSSVGWLQDPILIVVIALAVVITIAIALDRDGAVPVVRPAASEAVAEQSLATAVPPPPPAQPTAAPVSGDDPAAIIMPYDDYILTQGLHGQAYGHLAIDIKAGKGAIIKSPIAGTVTSLYTDEVGNPTLIIENDVYQVMMLHGVFTVKVGDQVEIGEPVGTESNLGNTRDAWGNSCRGRDCGYHTHLNIFDKRLGVNVSPLEVLGLRLGP